MGTPVVKSTNGYGLPVTVVDNGGLPVSLAGNGYGTPIIEVAQGGLPISYDQGGGGFTALANGDTIAFLGCSVDADWNWIGRWRAFLTRINHRLQASPFGYFGWFGTRPDEWGTQLPNLLAAAPNVMLVGDWINASTPGVLPSLQLQKDTVESCMQQFGALPNSKEVWLTTTRLTQAVVTINRQSYISDINAWCAAQEGRKIGNARVRFLNVPYDISDAGPQADDDRDTLHDNTKGAIFYQGKKYAEAVADFLPAQSNLPTPGSPPVGNKTANPNFSGTSALVATGAGAANVSGTKATGVGLFMNIASGVNVVAEALQNGQRFTMSGNNPGTADVYMTVSVTGLPAVGKKFICYARYQISAADGVSKQTAMRQLQMLVPTIGSDGGGPLLAGYGDIVGPIRGSNLPVNPDTAIAESTGDPWIVSKPVTSPPSLSSGQFRFYMSPATGPVDIMIDWTDFVIVEVHERKGKPFYQGQVMTRIDGGTTIRLYACYIGPYTCGGNFPARNATTNLYSIAAANANNSWVMQPGDWSGDPDSYDGTVEVMKSGSGTWTLFIASLASTSWLANFTGYGLAAGDQVRTTITATTTGYTPTVASEICTIT